MCGAPVTMFMYSTVSSQRRHADGYWKVSVMISLAYFLALCSVGAYQAKKHESKTTQVLGSFRWHVRAVF